MGMPSGASPAERMADTLTERATALRERIGRASIIVGDMLPPSPLSNKPPGVVTQEPAGLTAVLMAAHDDMNNLVSRLEDLAAKLGRL